MKSIRTVRTHMKNVFFFVNCFQSTWVWWSPISTRSIRSCAWPITIIAIATHYINFIFYLLTNTILNNTTLLSNSLLTHQILIVVVVRIVNDSHAVALIVATQTARSKTIAIHRRTTLEARLSQAFVQTFAERSSSDFGMKLTAEARISISLECCVRSSTAGEQMWCNGIVWVFVSSF